MIEDVTLSTNLLSPVVIEDGSDPTLLTYVVATTPEPLTASASAASPSLSSMQIIITNNGRDTVTLESVQVLIPVGLTATDLIVNANNVAPSVSDPAWTFTPSASSLRGTQAVFILQPQTGAPGTIAANASITLRLQQMPTSALTGSAIVSILETSSSGQSAVAKVVVTKFPAGFLFDSLTVNIANGTALKPVAQVNSGDVITLTWNVSSVSRSNIAIYYSTADGQASDTPTSLTRWTSKPLTQDTVFTVFVKAIVPGGNEVTAALSTGVSVVRPTLKTAAITATSLTLDGPGDLTVARATTLRGPLVTSGPASFPGGLTVSGVGLTVNQGLPARLNGSLTVSGATSLSGTNVYGPAYLNQGVTINGAVAALGTKRSITIPSNGGTVTFTPPTDGFVIGMVSLANIVAGANNNGSIQATSQDGVTASASGGTFVTLNTQGCAQTGYATDSFTLPVRKGQTCTILAKVFAGSPDFTCNFVPLGQNVSQALKINEDHEDAPVTPKLLPDEIIHRIGRSRAGIIAKFADLIDSLLPEPMSREKKEHLKVLMKRLSDDDGFYLTTKPGVPPPEGEPPRMEEK